MFSIKIFVLILCFVGHLVFAQEGSSPSPGGKGGAKDSGLPPWFQAEARIAELSAKIKATEEELKKLIEQKKQLPENSAQVKPLVKTILKVHSDMEKQIEEFQKNMNLLKYRFPERGQKAQRTYEKVEMKTVEDLEQAVGIDAKLSRNVNRMRTAYDVVPPKKATKKGQKQSSRPEGQEHSIEEQAPINITK